MTRLSFRLATAFVAIGIACMAPGAQAQNLTVAVGGNITSMDPHFHNLGPNNNIAQYFFDRLVHFDHQQRPIPGLAESWRAIDDTTWEFKLRRGVKFHDGSDFDAEDVLATFKRVPWVPNSPSSFTAMVRGLEVTVVDAHTMRFKTPAPRPLLPLDMAVVNIVSRKNVEAPTVDFNAGRAMLGTGPFKFKEFVPGDRVAMDRNDAYWGEKSPWSSVTTRIVTNASARTAALLSGDVQIIDQVQTADIPRLKQNTSLRLEQVTSNRLIYLHIDHNRDVTPFAVDKATGQPLAKNPLKDLRVRQAIAHAIDVDVIIRRVLRGQGIASGSMWTHFVNGWDKETEQARLPLDREKAKRLLAEAGYPSGFELTLDCPVGAYDEVCIAIAPMLAQIGIQLKVNTLPPGQMFPRIARGETSFYGLSWGVPTYDAMYTLRGIMMSRAKVGGSSWNGGGYSNAKFDELVEKAQVEPNPETRRNLIREAHRLHNAELGHLPLYHMMIPWAMGAKITAPHRADNQLEVRYVRVD
jgi:peptide/nickel transport system substrate-binding protein